MSLPSPKPLPMKNVLSFTGLLLVAVLSNACLNFDSAGGAQERFCEARPEICSATGQPTDSGTTTPGGKTDAGSSGTTDSGTGGTPDSGTGGTPYSGTSGGPNSATTFDPNRVYANGVAGRSDFGNSIIGDLFAPTQVYFHVPSQYEDFVIRPTDGALFYFDNHEYKVFQWKPDTMGYDLEQETYYFQNDSWLGRKLNSDDDKCLTRYVFAHGWKIAIQFDERSIIETTLEDNSTYIDQCLRHIVEQEETGEKQTMCRRDCRP